VTLIALHAESAARSSRMLRSVLAPIAEWLEAADVAEIMLNPDGKVWIDRVGRGLELTPVCVAPPEAERIIRLVAHHVGVDAHAGAPRVSAELPGRGERFEGLLPPVVAQPAFSIRKPACAAVGLEDYVRGGVMSAAQAAVLAAAVAARRNILVAGPTSCGKTTLAGALLAEPAILADRLVILEDTRELRLAAPNAIALRTADGAATLHDLVRSAMRLRPDRIVVGEVRGGEALDLLKAWATGHPGGVATIHAGSASGALLRLEQLAREAVVSVPRALLAEAVDLVAVLAGRGPERRLCELAWVDGLTADGGYRLRLEPLVEDQEF
jgi:type IV secretion system protein VirB11